MKKIVNGEEFEVSEEEMNALLIEWEYNEQNVLANQYKTQRVYPSIQDQLDMMYKDLKDGTSVWFDTITAVKAAHPKPEESYDATILRLRQ